MKLPHPSAASPRKDVRPRIETARSDRNFPPNPPFRCPRPYRADWPFSRQMYLQEHPFVTQTSHKSRPAPSKTSKKPRKSPPHDPLSRFLTTDSIGSNARKGHFPRPGPLRRITPRPRTLVYKGGIHDDRIVPKGRARHPPARRRNHENPADPPTPPPPWHTVSHPCISRNSIGMNNLKTTPIN
jgi:hypothetical protein